MKTAKDIRRARYQRMCARRIVESRTQRVIGAKPVLTIPGGGWSAQQLRELFEPQMGRVLRAKPRFTMQETGRSLKTIVIQAGQRITKWIPILRRVAVVAEESK